MSNFYLVCTTLLVTLLFVLLIDATRDFLERRKVRSEWLRDLDSMWKRPEDDDA